jgi:hypothetical protein
MRQARELMEARDFAGALEILAPLMHFRDEFSELASLHGGIEQTAASYYVEQARAQLAQNRFDDAVASLDAAAQYRSLEEIPALRQEIEARRITFQQQEEIRGAMQRAQDAVGRTNYAVAFDILAPVAARYPRDTRLQESFNSLRRVYRDSLLAEIVRVEKVHTPIRGAAGETALLDLYDRLQRLSRFDTTTEVAVWRDRVGTHLADYYRKRATTLATPEREALSPLAFAYLQQAHYFILNKAELTQFTTWRKRIEEQLKIRLALDFRDQTSEATRDYLVAELVTRVGTVIRESGFPHVEIVEVRRGTPAVTPTLEFVVQLLRARVQEETHSEAVASQYSAGTREVPNPAWREAKTVYDQAVENHEQIRTRIEQARRRGGYSKKQRQADEQALMKAEAGLKQAKQQLDAVSAFVQEEDVRPYEFTRRTLTRTAEIRLAYRWVNTQTGVLEGQDFLEAREPSEAIEISGVHAADKNAHRNQSASLPEPDALLGQALRKIQAALGERALGYLRSFMDRDFEGAREKAGRGERESAAEDYLRFLYNTTPDDPRRQPALRYLEQEFRLVALGEWLGSASR